MHHDVYILCKYHLVAFGRQDDGQKNLCWNMFLMNILLKLFWKNKKWQNWQNRFLVLQEFQEPVQLSAMVGNHLLMELVLKVSTVL